MLTLQRLPLIRILLAHIGGKVFFQEHPAPADSGGGNTSHGSALAQRGGMQLQEELGRLSRSWPIIFLTGHGDSHERARYQGGS